MKFTYDEIAPKFRKRKTYIAEWKKEQDLLASMGEYIELGQLIEKYTSSVVQVDELIPIMNQLYRLSLADLRFLIAKAMSDNCLDSRNVCSAVVKNWLALQLKWFNFQYFIKEFNRQGRTDTPYSFVSVSHVGNLLAFVSIFFNQLLFKSCLLFVLDLFDQKAVGVPVKSLSQLFILRLAEKFFNYDSRAWSDDNNSWKGDPCKEEPLFAQLWIHWDTEDLDLIHSLLMQLANRHTFQASRNNTDGGRDFEGHVEQYPMELHFIMRLREWRGLSNPIIQHRLTEVPFDKLPEPIAEIEFSESLQKLMIRVREVNPDFDSIINSVKKRDWKMLL